MRRAVFFCLFLAAVSSGLAGPAARAQTPEPSATEMAERAKRSRDAGRLDEAIDGFARAYQLSGESALLFNLADAHREAGHLEDALRIFQTYVRRDPGGANREAADRLIKDLEKRIESAKKSGSAAPARSAPAPAATPAAPVPAATPGIAAGPAAPAATTPPPLPPPPATPVPAATPPAPGVDLTAPGPVAPSESAGPPLPRWIPWVLTAATVGLGAGAIISGLSASNRYDQLHGSCGKVAGGCSTQDIDDVRGRARRANILWALTSVAAVGAGVTIYINVNAAGAAGLWSF